LSYGRLWAQDRPVWLLELPCHGSGGKSEDLLYQTLADTIAQGIEKELGGRSCIVLGHSLGGKAAMTLALSYPELVESLIVVDIAPRQYSDIHHRDIFTALESVDLSRIQRRSDGDRAMARLIPDQFTRAFFLKSLMEEEGSWRWIFDLYAIKHAFPNILAWNSPLKNGQVLSSSCPTLFVRGSLSDYVVERDFPSIKALFPKATIETVEGAGHWVQADKRDAFLQALGSYL